MNETQTNLFTQHTKTVELILQREHIIHSLQSIPLEQKVKRQELRKDVIAEEDNLKHRRNVQEENRQ